MFGRILLVRALVNTVRTLFFSSESKVKRPLPSCSGWSKEERCSVQKTTSWHNGERAKTQRLMLMVAVNEGFDA